MEKQLTGKKGEEAALEYLLQRGYKLIERNWRTRHLEIDLIMNDGINVRFIEVRSQTEPVLLEPYLTVDKTKRRRIISAAQVYVWENKIDSEVKFDIVSVIFDHKKCEIQYIPDAFNLLNCFYE